MTEDAPHQVGERPRVLIPITILFAVRYVLRTGLLERLADACVPVLAMSWDDPDLVAQLERDGLEVVRLPDPLIGGAVIDVLQQLEHHFHRRLASPSTPIDRRRALVGAKPLKRAKAWARRVRIGAAALRPGHEQRLLERLEELLPESTNLDENLAFLTEHRIDAVFSVTPFTAQERMILLAAERSGLPSSASILSFDNITTRPPLPILFDQYLVWNGFNREEILRSYRGATPEIISIVGPAQFDFYADPGRVAAATVWRSQLGLAEGPTVLYGAGASAVVPHETQYVAHLCEAIDDGRLPSDLKIVLRRHPVDPPGRWERFRDHPAVVFDEPGPVGSDHLRPGQVDLGDEEINHLCSTLSHTDVHVNASSTMTLDGAFYDKPQIGPAYDTEPGRPHHRLAADLYRREHFLPIIESGGLELATTPEELVDLVRGALHDGGRLATEREAMLVALCTYTDGACTERLARELQGFANEVAGS